VTTSLKNIEGQDEKTRSLSAAPFVADRLNIGIIRTREASMSQKQNSKYQVAAYFRFQNVVAQYNWSCLMSDKYSLASARLKKIKIK
jgi:hypothetical protein